MNLQGLYFQNSGAPAGNFLGSDLVSPGGLANLERGPSRPIFTRSAKAAPLRLPSDSPLRTMPASELKRIMDGGDIGQILALTGMQAADLQRTITTTTTGFPVRENLEAVAKILIPLDTPMRNRVPRVTGSGLAAQWRQLLSLGGGYAGATVLTNNYVAGNTVLAVSSTAGIIAGDVVAIDVGSAQEIRTVASTNAGGLTITLSLGLTSSHSSAAAVVKYGVQPGSTTTGALQSFYSETGAPASHQSVYANQSFGYKLQGSIGSVSGFAMAAGANFQNQLATEKRNNIWNVMLNEENAMINGNASSVLAPWGDGTNSWSYNGLVNLITTANGTPPDQVQTNVGPLTTGFIDAMLRRLWTQGGRGKWMLMGYQELLSLTHLAEGNGSIIRVNTTSVDGTSVMGLKIVGYMDPVTGETIPILPSRFVQQGTIIFGCDMLPDGSPALEMDVLPQTQLPALAPNTNVQGYVAQELAPTQAAPQVYPFIVSLFSVLKMKSFLHFAIATGITAV